MPGPDGARYGTDEENHRVLLREPDGTTWAAGGPGCGPGEFRYPRGLALVPGDGRERTRLFVCDSSNHRIQILDGNGRPRGAFGGHGTNPGQFAYPSDVVVCTIPEPRAFRRSVPPETLLVVADRANGRLQVFDLDGTFVAAVGGPTGLHDGSGLGWRLGWPFFRLRLDPAIGMPIRLRWRAPYLYVLSTEGLWTRVHLEAALLPPFRDWRRTATIPDLETARRFFRAGGSKRGYLPPAILAQIETDLGAAWLNAGLPLEAQRIWLDRLPAGLSPSAAAAEIAERRRLATAAAFTLGSYEAVRPLLHLLRVGEPDVPLRRASADRSPGRPPLRLACTRPPAARSAIE